MLQALFGLRRGRGFGRLSAKHAAIADPVQPGGPNRYYETLTRLARSNTSDCPSARAPLGTSVRRTWFTATASLLCSLPPRPRFTAATTVAAGPRRIRLSLNRFSKSCVLAVTRAEPSRPGASDSNGKGVMSTCAVL